MAIDLSELAKGALSDKIMGDIGGILGEDIHKTTSAVGSAIPAILGGLMSKASTSNGASELVGMLKDHDGGILDNLGNMFGDGKQNTLIEIGKKILSFLFGGKMDSVIGTLGKLAGMNRESTGSLLGMLAPVVMGVLGKQKKTLNLDTSSLTSLLMDQKHHIKLDSSLQDEIGIGNLFSGSADKVKDSVASMAGAARHSVDKVGDAANDAASSGFNIIKIILPILLIAALGYLIWSLVGRGTNPVEQARETLTIQLDSVTTAVENVNDAETAKTAADKFESASTAIGALNIEKMPAAAQSELKGPIGTFVEKIKGLLETAYKMPGVETILKPAADGLLKKLSGIAG